jgi:hypothetical protein
LTTDKDILPEKYPAKSGRENVPDGCLENFF